MKDIFSKITFGFLMAQFVPGCIAVIAISMISNYYQSSASDFITLVNDTIDGWFNSGKNKVLFAFLSTGAGMAIHGLNWAMLGFLEGYFGRDSDVPDDLMPIRENKWHSRPIWWQLLFGPGWMLLEIYLFVRHAGNLNEILMDENVGEIPKEKIPAFNFLQDFYLNFAQFYLHTSYALILFLFAAFYTSLRSIQSGDVLFLSGIYFLASYFF